MTLYLKTMKLNLFMVKYDMKEIEIKKNIN